MTATESGRDVPGAPPEPRDPVLGPEITGEAPDADALLVHAVSEGWRWERTAVDVWEGRVTAAAHLTRGSLKLKVMVGEGSGGGVYTRAMLLRDDAYYTVARSPETCAALVAGDPRVAADWSALLRVPARVAVVRDLVERAWGHADPTPQTPQMIEGGRLARTWEWAVPPLVRGRRVRWVTLTTWRPVVSGTAGAVHTTPLGHQISLGRQHTNLIVTYDTGAVKSVSDRQLAVELARELDIASR